MKFASPMNLPSRSSKPLASRDHSGRPTITSRTTASATTPARITRSSRDIPTRVGRAGTASVTWPLSYGEYPQPVGRQRNIEMAARLHAKVADQVRREVGSQRELGLGPHPEIGAAEGADEIEIGDLDRHPVDDIGRQIADLDILRPDAHPHILAKRQPVLRRAGEGEAGHGDQ